MKDKMHLPRYRYDLYVRIAAAVIGSFFVAQFGGNEPFLKLLISWKDFYLEWGVTFLITLLIIFFIYRSTRMLDIYFDWHSRPLWRFPLQILIGIIIPSLLTFLLATLYFSFYGINILDTNYQLYAFPNIRNLIIILNLYYYIRYLLEKIYYPTALQPQPILAASAGGGQSDLLQTEATGEQTPEQPLIKSSILVHTPSKSFTVPTASIAYFYRDRGKVFLRPFSGNDLILTQSLDSLEEVLDKEMFFRAARHMIVNRSAIQGYQPLLHGKLALILSPIYKQKLNVSKPQAPSFKSWLDR